MKKGDIKVFPDTKIFMFCPAGVKTGGPEVMLQLVYTLQNYIETYACYYDLKKPIVPNDFLQYKCKRILHFEKMYDMAHNIVIVPETYTCFLSRVHNVQKIIWWLSVDNYTKVSDTSKGKEKIDYLFHAKLTGDKFIFDIHKNEVAHMVQSEYARQYLESKGIKKIYRLSDYINDKYLIEMQNMDEQANREDIVLYNPSKGYEFTKKIMDNSPNIKFVPIVGMSNDEILCLMKKSKVYIDFGNHPGKDRLPREAAAMGLCVITGKKGSANNDVDVCIPNRYKFDDKKENIELIINCINVCMRDYDNAKRDFDEYRKKIQNEKGKFKTDIKNIFGIQD
jgi:hypothetical protein